jgi:hypothetical protein
MTRVSAACLLLTAALAWPSAAGAQPADGSVEKGRQSVLDAAVGDAESVRSNLQELLGEHPPNLRIVLQADPSLLQRPDYVSVYPRLAAFLKAHPEVARDPAYFLGTPNYFGWHAQNRTTEEQALETLQGILAGMAVFTVILAALIVLGTLIRGAFAHRRWVRQSRVQTEVHTKILDRLQSNEDLLSYIQTPAGQRFLDAGPSPKRDVEPRVLGAPYGRILWSLQAGVMLMALGVGFWVVQRSALESIAPAFGAIGTITVLLGVGGIVSAGLAYVLSARFGLLQSPAAPKD